MGMDVQVVGNHELIFNDVQGLIKALSARIKLDFESNTLTRYLSESHFPERKRNWNGAWEVESDPYYSSLEEEFIKAGCISFNGPFGHTLSIGYKSFALASPVRWSAFLKYLEIREPLRVFIFRILKSIGGTRVVYFPDNGAHCSGYDQYVYQKSSLSEILEIMKHEVGPPSEHLEDILRISVDIAINDGYYVDLFKDM